MCAEALIVHAERDRHWTEAGQALLQALIRLVLRESTERRNLVTVRALLMLTDARIKERLEMWPPSLEKTATRISHQRGQA